MEVRVAVHTDDNSVGYSETHHQWIVFFQYSKACHYCVICLAYPEKKNSKPSVWDTPMRSADSLACVRTIAAQSSVGAIDASLRLTRTSNTTSSSCVAGECLPQVSVTGDRYLEKEPEDSKEHLPPSADFSTPTTMPSESTLPGAAEKHYAMAKARQQEEVVALAIAAKSSRVVGCSSVVSFSDASSSLFLDLDDPAPVAKRSRPWDLGISDSSSDGDLQNFLGERSSDEGYQHFVDSNDARQDDEEAAAGDAAAEAATVVEDLMAVDGKSSGTAWSFTELTADSLFLHTAVSRNSSTFENAGDPVHSTLQVTRSRPLLEEVHQRPTKRQAPSHLKPRFEAQENS